LEIEDWRREHGDHGEYTEIRPESPKEENTKKSLGYLCLLSVLCVPSRRVEIGGTKGNGSEADVGDGYYG